jgi:hypothetical protein
MSMALQSYWQQVIQEYDELIANLITNLNELNLVLKTFFAGHLTEDDCNDLLESLWSSSKPKVQTYFYQIKELNDYVEWLPGHEEKLTESQLNLAFYNRLPGSWQEHQQRIINEKNKVLQAESREKLDCGREILS